MISLQYRKAVAVFSTLFIASGAFAATVTEAEYSSGKDRISADYQTDKAACAKVSGNAADVCKEQAKGKEKVSRAELEYSYTGKASDARKLAVAKADAAYAVAKQLCNDKAGNPKDVCITEAKAVHTKALADTKLSEKVGNAKQEASEDKRSANYKVAAQKCDALAGDAKDECIKKAKVKFHQD